MLGVLGAKMLLARLANLEFLWLQLELCFNKDWNLLFQSIPNKISQYLLQRTQIITCVLGKTTMILWQEWPKDQ